MFAPIPDRDLVEKANLIVQAEYLGQTEVNLGPQGDSLWLGVLRVTEVLKGAAKETVVLLAVRSPALPISSSDIVCRPGQTGLWLLAARPGGPKGVYVADHPQRFVPAPGGQARIDSLKKLLREKK